VRVSLAAVVVLPLAIAAFTVSRAGPLPVPALPASFDGAAATALTTELARRYPVRVPGGTFDEAAARWFAETLARYGLRAETDTWRQDVPGLGRVQLRNVAAVVEGSARGVIVVAAHRDTGPTGPGANDNASGTATLIQLARVYADTGAGRRPTPLHTLVFLSTDGGAWGGLGAERFARHSRFGGDVLATVVLDGLGGSRTPRLDVAGDGGRSPAPTLVRTALARVREQVGSAPRLPGLLTQLVDLGLPFGYGEQAPFLGRQGSAVRLTTADDSGRSDIGDRLPQLDRARLERLGAASQNLVQSLDASGELAQGSASALYLHGRVVRGWALALLLVALLVPFGLGVADLAARVRRLDVAQAPALRALRRRIGFWGALAILFWIATAVGFFPDGPARPLAPDGPVATDWPVTGLALLGGLGLVAWFATRRRLEPRRPVTREEELAGYTAALAGLLVLGVAVAIAHPLALVFLLPSLYAWLWLPQAGSAWVRDGLFGAGLAGALLVLVSIGSRFDLGGRTPLYLLQLASTGYVGPLSVVFVLVWLAVAAQLGTLVAGRYAPYASGVSRPPRGPIREGVRRIVRAAQSRRR
jgi:hypothetical protein